MADRLCEIKAEMIEIRNKIEDLEKEYRIICRERYGENNLESVTGVVQLRVMMSPKWERKFLEFED